MSESNLAVCFSPSLFHLNSTSLASSINGTGLLASQQISAARLPHSTTQASTVLTTSTTLSAISTGDAGTNVLEGCSPGSPNDSARSGSANNIVVSPARLHNIVLIGSTNSTSGSPPGSPPGPGIASEPKALSDQRASQACLAMMIACAPDLFTTRCSLVWSSVPLPRPLVPGDTIASEAKLDAWLRGRAKEVAHDCSLEPSSREGSKTKGWISITKEAIRLYTAE
ncbi:unnamed protein product [Protopolystoma xenopodis]|uniref:Uncharacterized protein n=1 Tax=Protopolystoma xenopodis TaxID=117903 RepID=A0A3S5BCR2_9PLAT|nr:unnamed protein product [Protopolystoma xenopodis]